MAALDRSARLWIFLAACVCFAGPAFAAPPTPPSKPACAGPQQLVANLAAHPTSENAVFLGSWYASRNQFGCAVDTFQAALKRDPSSAQLHYLTGLALFGGGQEPEAIAQLQQATRLDPSVIKPIWSSPRSSTAPAKTPTQRSSGSWLSPSTPPPPQRSRASAQTCSSARTTPASSSSSTPLPARSLSPSTSPAPTAFSTTQSRPIKLLPTALSSLPTRFPLPGHSPRL